MHGATRGGGLTGGGRQAFHWAEGGLVLAPMGDVPQVGQNSSQLHAKATL